ncbi:hypothetical protein ACOCEA_17265 [Maribacter sp. CXY002]|uniref:hypothetical protein n=1 Tax=Maribacter luteocoastalis TaxID=3407671 RepID=UPI003B66BC2B
MKTAVTIFRSGLLLLMILFTSCTKEGAQGDIGPIGPTGLNGANGVDGTDGTNGEDGVDGNANVTSMTFDVSAVSGTFYDLLSYPLTVDQVENNVVLVYIKAGNDWYQLPNQRILTGNLRIIDISTYMSGSGGQYLFGLEFHRNGTPFALASGDLDTLKLVFIEETSSTSGKSTTNSISQELKDQGVDVSNYFQVMDYFYLEY